MVYALTVSLTMVALSSLSRAEHSEDLDGEDSTWGTGKDT